MIAWSEPCPTCGKGVRVRIHTDGMGRTYDTLEDGCEHERLRRGICRECPRRVKGRVGQAKLCAGHRKAADRANWRRAKRRAYERDPEKFKKKARKWRKENPELHAEQIAKLKREKGRVKWGPGMPQYEAALERRKERRATDPEYRAHDLARQAAYRAKRRAAQTDAESERKAA